MKTGLGSCCFSISEAKVFGGVFRICEDEHSIVEAHLPAVVGGCLNLKIIDTVLTRIIAQGFTDLIHVESEHALCIDPDDLRKPYDLHACLFAHDFRNGVAFDAGAHGHSTAV